MTLFLIRQFLIRQFVFCQFLIRQCRLPLALLLLTTLSLATGCSPQALNPLKSTDQSAAVDKKAPPAAKADKTKKTASSKGAVAKAAAKPGKASPFYQQALDKGDSARSISQSAANKDDWELAVDRWEQAITLIKRVPKQDPNQKYIGPKLGEFEKGLEIAQQRAKGIIPIASASAYERRLTPGVTAPPGSGSRSFTVPIKYRQSRIPVIDVMFNNGQVFEMMVDTGASGTMITDEMAAALNLREVGRVAINTPAGQSTAGVGVLRSLSVGGKTIYDVEVTIGPVGLLGHDFFDDCEVSFRRDTIEFANCSTR
jgi:predicted aspartyl protease